LKDVLFSDIEQLPVEDLCSLLKGFYAAAKNTGMKFMKNG
jgi:hypothetical protein